MSKKYTKLKQKGSDKKSYKVCEGYNKLDVDRAKGEQIDLEILKKVILNEVKRLDDIGEVTFEDNGKIIICLSEVSKKLYLSNQKEKSDSQNVKNKISKFQGGSFNCYYSSKDDKILLVSLGQNEMIYTNYGLQEARNIAEYKPKRNESKRRFYSKGD